MIDSGDVGFVRCAAVCFGFIYTEALDTLSAQPLTSLEPHCVCASSIYAL